MLCMVIHLCPSGATFIFNWYQHHTHFIVRAPDGTDYTILGRKFLTQGDTLFMVVYWLVVLAILKDLQEVVPDIHQPLYINNDVDGVCFTHTRYLWDCLTDKGTTRGCFPEPNKSILVTCNPNLKCTREYFSSLDFNVINGKHYMGSCLGHIEGNFTCIQ